jgi:cytochrome b subunit of formate dehydrogenase
MFKNINMQRIKMHSPFLNLALAVAIHGIKNKTLINKLETFWINEELAAHGRYSPFMLEVQKNQDLKANFWSLSLFVLFVLVDGLILCSFDNWAIQCLGIAACLLATSMIANIGGAVWRSYRTGVLQTKEAT